MKVGGRGGPCSVNAEIRKSCKTFERNCQTKIIFARSRRRWQHSIVLDCSLTRRVNVKRFQVHQDTCEWCNYSEFCVKSSDSVKAFHHA
jgi:hypothetical protein